MDSKIIDGNTLAKKHEESLKKKLEKIKTERNPTVVSFCNQDDLPSVKYTFMKLAKASDLGIDFIAEEFSADTPQEKLIKLVKKYAEDSEIDGILVQLPLPEELNPFKGEILNLIPLEKDVDGLREESSFLPATVKAVISILDSLQRHPESLSSSRTRFGISEILNQVEYSPLRGQNDDIQVRNDNWEAKKIAVVGATGEVGKPLVKLLKEKNVDVIEISRNLGNPDVDLKDADIVVSAVGQEGLIKPEMLKMDVILIDVGLGDFDPKCYEKVSMYTPKTGGVGPMTVISLMENVVESYANNVILSEAKNL